MRLGQLARKLDITPAEIERYLYANGTFVEAGSNSRLEDADVHRVIVHFAPNLLAEVNRELEAEHLQESKAEPASETKVSDVTEEVTSVPAIQTPAPDPTDKPEVIKAPKVELQGLKVLGKIELPEPKKKPEPVRVERERREDKPRREQRPDRPWVNKLELQRQKEAQETEALKREEARQKKEQRALAYYNRLEKLPKKQQSKSSAAADTTAAPAPATRQEPPRTLLGKVWRWLTQAE